MENNEHHDYACVMNNELRNIVDMVVMVIVNDRAMHKVANDAYDLRCDVRFNILRQGLKEADYWEEYFECGDLKRRALRYYIRLQLVNHFDGVYQAPSITNDEPTDNLQEKLIMNTYSPVVVPREALVFGHALSKLTKDELMEVIRAAQKQSASFDGLPDSNFVSKQIADIEAGIQLCLKQLDK